MDLILELIKHSSDHSLIHFGKALFNLSAGVNILVYSSTNVVEWFLIFGMLWNSFLFSCRRWHFLTLFWPILSLFWAIFSLLLPILSLFWAILSLFGLFCHFLGLFCHFLSPILSIFGLFCHFFGWSCGKVFSPLWNSF